MKLLMLLALLTACGPAYHTPEVGLIVTEFESTYSQSTSSVTILISDTLPDAPVGPGLVEVGVCESRSRTITIQKATWAKSTDTYKRSLLFHELGHCIFNRVHRTDMYNDGCPKSIMYPIVLADNCFNIHSNDLIAELPGQ
jgi:hypothetical protein